jgi:hypothetical protein
MLDMGLHKDSATTCKVTVNGGVNLLQHFKNHLDLSVPPEDLS